MSGRVTQVAHELLAPKVQLGARVLDATVGWGQDTLWLAHRIGAQGQLWGMDRQADALAHTQQKLNEQGLEARARLWKGEHKDVQAWPDGPPPDSLQAAVLNLGYLPGKEEHSSTQLEQTQVLLAWLFTRLAPQGRMVCCVYLGHAEGQRESAWLGAFAERFPSSYGPSWVHRVANRGATCPWIWSVDRMGNKGFCGSVSTTSSPANPSDP